jgi:PAS domain S-box-containing protein
VDEQLQESSARLKSLIDRAPFGICRSSLRKDRFESVNPALCRMLGYSEAELLSMSLSKQLYATAPNRFEIIELLKRDRKLQAQETILQRKDGSQIRVRANAFLTPDEDGELDRVEAYIEDLTEQSALEQQVRAVQKLEAVGRLAGGVAHDFNNILTVIIGYSELAMYRLGSGHGISKHLSEIKTAAERAASLTRQLLAFSRQQVLYPRILDVNSVVNNLMQMLLRLIGEDISLTFKAGSVGNIKADMGQVEQILMNLVVNARDAMPQGGAISIETSTVELEDGYIDSHLSVRPGRYVMLSVSDTGCGMDEKTVSQIFEPFFTTKGPGQGTGLGLSTVYGIVKQSDGYIWVYSEPGRGTTLKVYFPQQSQGAQALLDTAAALELASGTETILVVEDDEALRKLITTLLGGSGYKVLQSANGVAALELVKNYREPIDLVLTDMLMPGMSGIELSSQLRCLRPNVKVLLMSGYAGDLFARYHVAESEIILIEKPFTRHGLLSKIRGAMR